MKKPIQWIRCPRCELNWIQKREKFCSVCKAEMKANGNMDDISAFDDDLELCPICKSNYISEGEDMCPSCAKLRASEFDGDESEKSDDWKTYIYEKDDAPEEEFDGDLTIGTMDDESETSDDELDIPLEDIDDDEEEEEFDEAFDEDDDDDLDFDDEEYDSDDDDEDDDDSFDD